jgi:hypothetical protein
MSFQDELDEFVSVQLQGKLNDGEDILGHGYLTAGVHSGTGTFEVGEERVGKATVGALFDLLPFVTELRDLARPFKGNNAGYFAVLTNQRLMLIKTRIWFGHNIPLKSQRIESYPHEQIDASCAYTGLKNNILHILFSNNTRMALYVDSRRKLERQTEFVDLMEKKFGNGEKLLALQSEVKSDNRKVWLGIGISFVIGILFFWVSAPEVSVLCHVDLEKTNIDLYYNCTVEHSAWFRDAETCLSVRLTCPDGRLAKSPKRCVTVSVNQTRPVSVSVAERALLKLQDNPESIDSMCLVDTEVDVKIVE